MIYFLIADKHFGQYRIDWMLPAVRFARGVHPHLQSSARSILVDAAAEVPPFDNLSAYPKMGVDLVAFSGGKGCVGRKTPGCYSGAKT